MYFACDFLPSVRKTIRTFAPARTFLMIVPPQASVSSSGCGEKMTAEAAKEASSIGRAQSSISRR